MLCNISQNAMRQRRGGVPGPPRGGCTRVRYPPWGGYLGQVPPWGVPGSGTPPQGGTQSGTPPGGVPGSGPPRGVPGSGTPGGTQSGPPPGGYPGQVPPPGGGYPGRTTEGVLTTRRAVCLLRSRRRTFLFSFCSVNDVQLALAKVIPIVNGLVNTICADTPNQFIQVRKRFIL